MEDSWVTTLFDRLTGFLRSGQTTKYHVLSPPRVFVSVNEDGEPAQPLQRRWTLFENGSIGGGLMPEPYLVAKIESWWELEVGEVARAEPLIQPADSIFIKRIE